ncbi:MAG: Rpp14/Pop5 family protein [Candidatus Nezhaarchaeota archaeon]|nr:Rpp14/Pop5 family protein [Candidatus Nezhaarchaeota archaeon]
MSRVKDRRRYLVLCIHSEVEGLKPSEVFEELKKVVARLHGEQGLSLCSLSLASENPLVVRCSHRYVPLVRSGVVALREVRGRVCMAHVVKCTGTLKKALRG